MIKPTVTREGDDFRFEWADTAIQVIVGNVRESSGDLSGIVRVNYVNGRVTPLLAPSRLNLVAPQSRASLAKSLHGRGAVENMELQDWIDIIETASGGTHRLWERGEPFVDLATEELPPWDRRELIKGFLPRNDPLTLFADGGSGKSTFAAALALSTLTGREILPGLPPLDEGPVFYLDWESNKEEHGYRLRRLAQHLGIALPERFIYRRNYRAFTDDLGTFRREVARSKPVLTIIDSAVPASGDDIKEAASPRGLFNGLRGLSEQMASMVLAHMSKSEAEKESGRSRVMGSVMFENLSRSVWEARPSTSAPADVLVTAFFHRKMNGGRRRDPFALMVAYDDDELPRGFERVNIKDYADLEERLPGKERLNDILRFGPRSTKDVADALGMPAENARKLLQRSGMQQIGGGRGRGNTASWALPIGEAAPVLPTSRWQKKEEETEYPF